MNIQLRGLPEALIGKSEIEVSSRDELITQYPILGKYCEELSSDQIIEDYDPCDG